MAKPIKKLVDLVVDRYVNLELFYRMQEPQANGCINWTGVTSNIGYGFIGFRHVDPNSGGPMKGNGGMMTAHRLAFMIANKRLPVKRNVNHTCHNKLCVRPDHLVEGTQRDKLDAMKRDGIRGGRQAGITVGSYNHKQANRTYRYSEAEIQLIRSSAPKDLARMYDIDIKRAYRMKAAFRNGYKWLPLPEDRD